VATWTLVGFNWSRFHTLAPALKNALASGDLTGVADPEAAAWLLSLDEMPAPEIACNFVISELCCADEELRFRGALPDLLIRLTRTEAGEEAADILGRAAVGGSGVEPWFKCDEGLVGILTWAELDRMHRYLQEYVRQRPPRQPRGPLDGLKRLVGVAEPEYDMLDDMLAFVSQLVSKRLGLAVTMTNP